MANAGELGTAAQEARSDREVEALIGYSQNALGTVVSVNNRLREMTSRLMGLNEPEVTPDAPEPVRNELEQLNYLLNQINAELGNTCGFVTDLERI